MADPIVQVFPLEPWPFSLRQATATWYHRLGVVGKSLQRRSKYWDVQELKRACKTFPTS